MEQNPTLGGHPSVLTGWVKREDNIYMYRESERERESQKGNERGGGYGGGETDSQTQRCKTSILIKAVGISQLFKIVFNTLGDIFK